MKTINIFLMLFIGVFHAESQNVIGVLNSHAVAVEFARLPYNFDELDKFIDNTTMEIHYSKHYKGYYDNLIKAVKDAKLEQMPLYELFKNTAKYPIAIRNHGGGYFNHLLFWEIMSPDPLKYPEGKLFSAIVKDFQSVDNLKKQFEEAARAIFGSGWAWLAVDANGSLFISSTPNQDNPVMDVAARKGIPIMGLDVWEHAYYLRYQNKRADYIGRFWEVLDWSKVAANYDAALKYIETNK